MQTLKVGAACAKKLNVQSLFYSKKGCNKFDHSRKGSLTSDEFYNVVKIQNAIEISKDDVGLRIISKNCKNKIILKLLQLKRVTSNLPKDKENRIKIKDFLYTNTQSDLYFDVSLYNEPWTLDRFYHSAHLRKIDRNTTKVSSKKTWST